jgi:oligopeptidase B
VISSFNHSSDQKHIISLSDTNNLPTIVKIRSDSVRYAIEDQGDYLYMMINDTDPNFRIMRIKISELQNGFWEEYISADPTRSIMSFDITASFMLLNYKSNGLDLVKILHMNDGKAQVVNFLDEAYVAYGYVANYNNDEIRIDYSSLSHPKAVYGYNFDNNKTQLIKVQQIPSGYNAAEYAVKRIFAENATTKIPVSLVYKKSLMKQDGTNPLYLYGYGSYGISVEPSFRSNIISLLDRGFVFAIAHVRGGSDLGYKWYLDGKLLNKKNTFNDFIKVAEKLISEKYTSTGNIVAHGGSAGGMLMGAIVNMRPDLFKAIIAEVPFVDVLNTMLDETLPLTPGEYNEFGNPQDRQYFDYISSYSPYENIVKQNYPSMFVTSGLYDERVSYWEPMKWIAKLREFKTDDNKIILKTNMSAGHFGSSDKFAYLREIAERFSYITKIFNIEVAVPESPTDSTSVLTDTNTVPDTALTAPAKTIPLDTQSTNVPASAVPNSNMSAPGHQ